MNFAKGIDVSTWQDNGQTPQRIDWTKPAPLGVKFVINRAVFVATKDDDFDYNFAQQRGRYLRGVYGFLGYWPGAASIAAQARALIDTLEADPGEMPVFWLDVEKASANYPDLPARSALLPMIETYLKTVEDATGLQGGIYTNLAGIARLSPVPDWLKEKPLWLAWPVTPPNGETAEAYIERVKILPPVREWRNFKIWQYSWKGPGLAMGMESNGLDMNFFNGSEAELAAWCNQTEPPKEEPVMDWTKNAIGLYTTKAGWTNPAFNFIVGFAGGNWTRNGAELVLEPNPNLKPIELQAHAEKKPFLALWDMDVDYYRRQQYDASDDSWPNEARDYPFQRLIAALQNRAVDGLIIRVMNRMNLDGGKEDMAYVAFAARKFVERANRWLYTNKGLDKWCFVLTSDDFLRIDGKQENFYTWTKDWWLGIEQEGTKPPAAGAWPQDGDKIKAIPASQGWKLWYHYNTASLDMMIWNGTAEQMYSFIGFEAGNPGDTTPPSAPSNLSAEVTGAHVKLTWTASTDNIKVEKYQIYRGSVLRGTSGVTTWTDIANPGETWTYEVEAVDQAGNKSARAQVTVTIPGAGGDVTRAEFDALQEDVEKVKSILKELTEWRDQVRAYFKQIP